MLAVLLAASHCTERMRVQGTSLCKTPTFYCRSTLHGYRTDDSGVNMNDPIRGKMKRNQPTSYSRENKLRRTPDIRSQMSLLSIQGASRAAHLAGYNILESCVY